MEKKPSVKVQLERVTKERDALNRASFAQSMALRYLVEGTKPDFEGEATIRDGTRYTLRVWDTRRKDGGYVLVCVHPPKDSVKTYALNFLSFQLRDWMPWDVTDPSRDTWWRIDSELRKLGYGGDSACVGY